MKLRRPQVAGAQAACRSASPADVAEICTLVNYWAEKGIMLPRSEKEVLESLSDFSVLDRKGEILACGALAPYGTDLAELRSVAVSPKEQRSGLGRTLCEFLIAKGRKGRFPRLFAFTYVPGFFEKLGFRIAWRKSGDPLRLSRRPATADSSSSIFCKVCCGAPSRARIKARA